MPEESVNFWNLAQYLIQQNKLESGTFAYSAILIGGALICIFLPYLLGSIPVPRLIYRLFCRKSSEGPAPFTVSGLWQLSHKRAAIGAAALEVFFAAFAYWLGFLLYFGMSGGAIAGFFVVFGRMYPVFTKFRSEKGVIPLAAVILCISPITFAVLLVLWTIITLGTRYVALASVMSALLYPLILRALLGIFGRDGGATIALAVFTVIFIALRHWKNLKSIYEGKEPKLQFPKKKKGDGDGTA